MLGLDVGLIWSRDVLVHRGLYERNGELCDAMGFVRLGCNVGREQP